MYSSKSFAPFSLSTKFTTRPPVVPSWPIVALDSSSPLKSGGNSSRSMTSPAFFVDRAEGDEIEAPGLADEAADGVRIGDAGQLDDDPVGALRRDDRLGDAGRVHPPLDDLADDLEVLGSRDLVADLLRLVLDAETAAEVEAEPRLDQPLTVGGRAVWHAEARNEVDDEGEDADDEDEDRAGFAHRRRMIQGTCSPPVREDDAPPVGCRRS